MAKTTISLGGGLTDTANQSTSVTSASGTDIVSNVLLTTTSTYLSGGFDSLGNSYTTRPVAVVDVSVRVAATTPTGTRLVAAQFSSSATGSPSTSSGSVNLVSSVYSSTITLSTTSTYEYEAFAGQTYYYGFETNYSSTGTILYADGGTSGTIYKDGTSLSSTRKLSGEISYNSIPSAPSNVNALSITDISANITWSAPTDDGLQSPAAYSAANIKGYRINYRNSNSENWKVLVANTGSNALSRIVTGLSPSTYYEIQVAALNSVTDVHNATYTSMTAHVGSRSVTKTFTTAVSTNDARIWTGSEFKKSIIKIWNGAAWIQYPNVRAKVWSGITTRTNLVVNPNFETNTTNWSVPYGSLSRVTTTPQTGTYCLQIDSDGEGYLSAAYVKSNSFSIGTSYRAGLWVRAASAGYTLQLTLSDNGSSTANTVFVVTTSWQFVQTPSITATGTTATLSIDGYPVNDPIFVDSAIIETASTYTGTFFDGNTPDSSDIDYAWTGTANASTSTATSSGFKELALDS